MYVVWENTQTKQPKKANYAKYSNGSVPSYDNRPANETFYDDPNYKQNY